MKLFFARVLVYAVMLLCCLAVMAAVSLVMPLPTWKPVGVALWYLLCLCGLCMPDEVWERGFRRK